MLTQNHFVYIHRDVSVSGSMTLSNLI